MNVGKHCNYAVVEDVEPFMHLISMPYIHNVFQSPLTVVDGHMAAHSHRYHHRCFPRFGRVLG